MMKFERVVSLVTLTVVLALAWLLSKEEDPNDCPACESCESCPVDEGQWYAQCETGWVSEWIRDANGVAQTFQMTCPVADLKMVGDTTGVWVPGN